MKIGYVPRAHNTIIAALLAQGAPLECTITTVDPKAEAWNAVEAEIRQVRQEEHVPHGTAFFQYDSGPIEAPNRQERREKFVAEEPTFFQYDTGASRQVRCEPFEARETAYFRYDDGPF